MSLMEQIQQDQAKRQVLVNWHQDQLATTMLKRMEAKNEKH